MAQNTTNLEGYTVVSSLSLAGSGATLLALDVSSYVTSSIITVTQDVSAAAGSALLPGYNFISEQSLGLYRSATSQIAVSYGTFNTSGLVFTTLAGSAFTIGSSATTKTIADGKFYFSVLSLTSNGAEIAFRSGSTVYKFASVSVG